MKKISGIFARYISLVLLGFGNLYLFHKLLTPLTVNIISFFLSLVREVETIGSTIYLRGVTVEIAPACVIGSAFYLLLILIFTTPEIKPFKRIWMTVFAVVLLFVLNIARILLLIGISDLNYFQLTHWIFWNLISIGFVVGIWFLLVRIFSVKKIPFYSDIKYFYGLTSLSKKSKRRKKNN